MPWDEVDPRGHRPLRAEMYTVTRNPTDDDQMQRLQEECNALRDRVAELEREIAQAHADG
jgi:hypothetical protein